MSVDRQNELDRLHFLIGNWIGGGEGSGRTSQVEEPTEQLIFTSE
jgi:hypothetical protein